MLIEARLAQGRTAEALKLNEELIELQPGDSEMLLNKTAMLIQLDRAREAVPILDRLIAREPRNDKAVLNRAIAHLKAGDYEKARSDYNSLLGRYPDFFNLHYGLGEIGYHTRDKEMALRHYRLYLKNAPPAAPEAKQVEARIKELEGSP
jgi:tetratricopeptide (TPR) repeat protein